MQRSSEPASEGAKGGWEEKKIWTPLSATRWAQIFLKVPSTYRPSLLGYTILYISTTKGLYPPLSWGKMGRMANPIGPYDKEGE